jgi:hypothetical protein
MGAVAAVRPLILDLRRRIIVPTACWRSLGSDASFAHVPAHCVRVWLWMREPHGAVA